MKDRIPKCLLNRIAAKYLPHEIVYGRKIGFTHVFVPYFENHLPELFRNDIILRECPIKEYIFGGVFGLDVRELAQ